MWNINGYVITINTLSQRCIYCMKAVCTQTCSTEELKELE